MGNEFYAALIVEGQNSCELGGVKTENLRGYLIKSDKIDKN